MMRFSLILLVCYCLLSCQRTETVLEQEKPDLVATIIDSILVSNNFNGVVLLAKDTSIIHSAARGFSDLENEVSISLNDQFVIGSISKQITAVLILREYEKGNIQLENTIGSYLVELEQEWSGKVTIHHLLTHTHGIVDLAEPLAFISGTQFQYSQLGFELLAQLLEKVTGKSFAELSESLFHENGLTAISHPDIQDYNSLVKGYVSNEQGGLTYATNSLKNFVAAGSFISNAADLIRWNHLLYSGKLVREETLHLMKSKYATREHPIFGAMEYGYGLLYKVGEADVQIGAFGYAPGFVSANYHYPETGMNLIVLENTALHLPDFKMVFDTPIKLMELVEDYK